MAVSEDRDCPKIGRHGDVRGEPKPNATADDERRIGERSHPPVAILGNRHQPEPIGAEAFGARYALPIWADFMQRAARIRPSGGFERPAGLQEEALCAISYLKPVDGCPLYTEYFKEGDSVPTQLCQIHQGSLQQRAERAIQGLLGAIGRGIRGIFR